MPESEAQRRAWKKYRAEKVKQLNIAFYPDDVELYEYVAKQPNKAGFIKELIREAMDASRMG